MDIERTPPPKLVFCSFCGKSQKEVGKLIAGPAVFICDECVELCQKVIDEEERNPDVTATPEPPKIVYQAKLKFREKFLTWLFWAALAVIITLQVAILRGM